ncbi:MAG: hypothetical protein HYU36_23880 [Planctomycetes bacterium]|nr:hypothetical protein [Planctomycetota bacterium]
MKPIRFETEIGEDHLIRPPKNVQLKPGKAEVIVFQKDKKQASASRNKKSLQERLARAARKLGIPPLPSDLATNHDHYAHGAPKGVDAR